MSESEWTVDTLRAHLTALIAELDRRVEQRFLAQEKAVEAALAAAKEAVLKAEAASERRFEAVNEFRAVLTDQSATFVTRTEVDQRLLSMGEKLEAVQGQLKEIGGLSLGSAGTRAALVSLVLVAASVVGIVVAVT